MLTTQQHSCSETLRHAVEHMCAMSEDTELAAEIRAWLNQVMEETSLTPTSWAKAAKVARTTIARPLKDTYEFVTSSKTLSKLAKAAGVEAPDIRRTREIRVAPRFLSVRYRVQAGHWVETDAALQAFPMPPRPVPPDPAYAVFEQWLELVVGDSIDREIPPGGFAHVVDAIDMGYAVVQGDFVVVERRRAGGHLRERSIKQVEIQPDGTVEFWPRSHNPVWNKPLALTDGMGNGEGVEVEVVGLVIGSYRGMR